ncbi:MAG: carboxypeptidase-like regulatory domain-containing protein [Candidatus Kryptoniota bacterium]
MNLCSTMFVLILFCNGQAESQNVYTVSGKVLDSKTGEPLAAASVRVSGSARGTITNLDGTYSMSLPQGKYIFICSYVGY